MARRPLNGNPRISCDDRCHKARGSLGGTDYAVPIGTPVYAPFDGVFSRKGNPNMDTGYFVNVHRPNGDYFSGQHLNGFAGGNRTVKEGDLIAYSGNTGKSTGPHLHAHVVTGGKVVGMEEYLGNTGGGSALLPTQRRVVSHAFANGRSRPTTKAPRTGEPLEPRTVGNFNGWARGQNVSGNDVWFRGISGRWFWSGGFEGGAKTAGLPEVQAPAEPKPPVTPDPPSVPSPVDPVEPDPVEPDPVDPTDPVEPPDDEKPPEKPDVKPPLNFGKGRILTGTGVAIITVAAAILLSQCGGPAL